MENRQIKRRIFSSVIGTVLLVLTSSSFSLQHYDHEGKALLVARANCQLTVLLPEHPSISTPGTSLQLPGDNIVFRAPAKNIVRRLASMEVGVSKLMFHRVLRGVLEINAP
jgi:hypothetical protein